MKNDEPQTLHLLLDLALLRSGLSTQPAASPDSSNNRAIPYSIEPDEGYLQSTLAALGPAPADDDINANLAAVKQRSMDMTPIWDAADLGAAINDAADRIADSHGEGGTGPGRHRRPGQNPAGRPSGLHDLADLEQNLSPGGRAIIEQCIGAGALESCPAAPAQRPRHE